MTARHERSRPQTSPKPGTPGASCGRRRIIVARVPALSAGQHGWTALSSGEREGLHMKTSIWPDDTSMLQMSDWLAELRDDGDAEVPAGRHARSASARGRRPESGAATTTPGEAIPREGITPPAEAVVRAETMARTENRARARITARAVIGDELRIPIMWCELGGCISRHSDPAALGEADIRARAIAAGWRVDALGRLVCPRCQQSDGRFWATHPVTPHDREAAVTRAELMAAVAALREDAAGALGGGAEAGLSPAAEPPLVPLPAQERQWQPV
jgi:hypothetical protein